MASITATATATENRQTADFHPTVWGDFFLTRAFHDEEFSLSRYFLAKFALLVSHTDDIYDAYGKIDELERFTAAIQRWDTSMKDLPEYMTHFFQALIDALEEVRVITSREGRSFCVDYAKQAQKKQTEVYLIEARWLANGEVPSVEEYRRVGVYSCTYPLLANAALCGMGEKAPREVFEWFESDPNILVAVSDHCRLMDDIVSHEFEQKRVHVVSSVDCYMKQYGATKEEAVDALNKMVEEDWKTINKECLDPPSFVSKEVLTMLVGFARVMEVLYKDSD